MARKWILVAVNLGICALLSPAGAALMAGMTCVSFLLGKGIARVKGTGRKVFLAVSVTLTAAAWLTFRLLKKDLPLGLSFYTFKILSYLIDVYRGDAVPAKDFAAYAAAVTLFSELLSGPVTRPSGAMAQLEEKALRPGRKLVGSGLMLLSFGAFKKFVLANRLAVYTDAVFSAWREEPALALWAAVFFYSVQLWADFAGYSEMSQGVSALLGLRVGANFSRPYLAVSIRDFWRRWHISLSSWLRDYVYIPLGGSRKGKLRKAANTLITFLVSGFWHGSGSGFLLWGLWHGTLNLLPSPRPKKPVGRWLCRILTFCAAAFGWIFFRLERAPEGFAFLSRMLTGLRFSRDALVGAVLPFTGDNTSVAALLTVLGLMAVQLFCDALDERRNLSCDVSGAEGRGVLRCALCLTAVALLGVFGGSSFIYMNF